MSKDLATAFVAVIYMLIYVGVVTALYVGIVDGYSPSTAKIVTAIFVWLTGPMPKPEMLSLFLSPWSKS